MQNARKEAHLKLKSGVRFVCNAEWEKGFVVRRIEYFTWTRGGGEDSEGPAM
jgi:hypothetical protein